jgi:thiol-disulfide isomerase/thioredoxin
VSRPRSHAGAVAIVGALAALTRAARADEPPAAPAAAPAAASAAAPAAAEAAQPPEEPEFSDAAGGALVRASQHRGEVVVLNFWATWCPPCRGELPLLEQVAEEYGPKGVRLICAAANGRDDAELVRRVLADAGVKADAWDWVTAKDMRYYGVGPGIPATVILDRAGTVRRRVQGPIDPASLRPLLDDLLKEPAPK